MKENRDMTSDLPERSTTQQLLLLIAVVAQLISLLITWPLWNIRSDVPHLPAFEHTLPQISFGWVLVISLVVTPFRPKFGIWTHFTLMLFACLFDQMRAQPQFLATWILMLATVSQNWKNYTRWFLVSLWIWAGLQKAISPDWNAHRAFNTAAAIGLDPAAWYTVVAIVVAASESSVGLLAWFKPKWGAAGCILLHLGIAIYLSPLGIDWNYSVLPWNLASAIIGAWILWTCDASPTKPQRAAFAAFMLAPVGFFFGLLDHGYAHVLYSGSIPQGLITRADGSTELIKGWGDLAIPFPNERRTIKQRFSAASKEGDRLHILDPRWALPDLHFVKRDSKVEQIDREKFFAADLNSKGGIELDSALHVFRLQQAGARLLKRGEGAMVYVVEFESESFEAQQLEELKFLPNIEAIDLSATAISDKDLSVFLELPKLTVIDLSKTSITDRGIEILSKSKSLEDLIVDNPDISLDVMQRFFDSR